MFKRVLLVSGLLLAVGLFSERTAQAQFGVSFGARTGFYPSGAYRSYYPSGYYPGYNPYGYVAPIGFPTYSAGYYTAGYRGYGYGAYNYSPYIYTTNYFPYGGYAPVYRAGYSPYVCPYGFPCW